jgi:endonuclease/exonuclease/phosphatase family metal-dependent hydrolase
VRRRSFTRRITNGIGLALALLLTGCAARQRAPVLVPVAATIPCRVAFTRDGPAPQAVAWLAAADPCRRAHLDAWCEAGGPPVIVPDPAVATSPTDDLVILTWNLHVGAADVAELVHRLRTGALTGRPATHFVLLVQEARRAGPLVPSIVPAGSRTPHSIRPHAATHVTDIVESARSLGLALYYVPSMRNGSPPDATDDRGNAILSTQPLSGFAAFELPFERQRRVAIAATVSGQTADGAPWTLRVTSVHLETMASARHLWFTATAVRVRQARALLHALHADGPLVLGGDFNTWFGFSDPAYHAIARELTDAAAGDRRPTFGSLFRLDHLFCRLPAGWSARATRLDRRLGSDHYPLLATLRMTTGTP